MEVYTLINTHIEVYMLSNIYIEVYIHRRNMNIEKIEIQRDKYTEVYIY